MSLIPTIPLHLYKLQCINHPNATGSPQRCREALVLSNPMVCRSNSYRNSPAVSAEFELEPGARVAAFYVRVRVGCASGSRTFLLAIICGVACAKAKGFAVVPACTLFCSLLLWRNTCVSKRVALARASERARPRLRQTERRSCGMCLWYNDVGLRASLWTTRPERLLCSV